jgi:hypothetical protein
MDLLFSSKSIGEEGCKYDQYPFFAVLALATICFYQPVRTCAVSSPYSKSASTYSGNVKATLTDLCDESKSVVVPEEPPTIVLLTLGLGILAGIGVKLKKTIYFR